MEPNVTLINLVFRAAGALPYALFPGNILKPKHSLKAWISPPRGGGGLGTSGNKEIWVCTSGNKGNKRFEQILSII